LSYIYLLISLRLTPANPPSLAPDSPVGPPSRLGFRLLTPPSALELFFSFFSFFDFFDFSGSGDSVAFLSDFSDFSSFSSFTGFSTLSGDSLGYFLDLDLELLTDFSFFYGTGSSPV
jgi:hypothetical protein